MDDQPIPLLYTGALGVIWEAFHAGLMASAADSKLDQVLATQTIIIIRLTAMEARMTALDDKITNLKDAVTALTTVQDSAVALLNGIGARIEEAVQAALAAGATAAQLLSLTDLTTTLGTETTELAEAVAANTPMA